MLKAYKYKVILNEAQEELMEKYLAAAVWSIIRHWHTGKRSMRMRRNP